MSEIVQRVAQAMIARQMDAQIVGCEATWNDLALAAVKIVEDSTILEALKLGREAVAESFDHAETKDDHLMAEMRIRTIDSALSYFP